MPAPRRSRLCHPWNLVAAETREGAVLARLLEKVEEARKALGGKVYDVLGELFESRALKDLLVEAIRYGEREEVRARLFTRVDTVVDHERILTLVAERKLAPEGMTATEVAAVHAEMERAEARRLQPRFIRSFFEEAFRAVGGALRPREPGRFEVTNVPVLLRDRDFRIGRGDPVLPRYARICFDKAHVPGSPQAVLMAPGHPLLDATVDWVLDGTTARGGVPRSVSERLQFVLLDERGGVRDGGPAPHLDLRPATEAERRSVGVSPALYGLGADLEARAVAFAFEHLVPEHLAKVRARRHRLVGRTESEVKARLMREIAYWDNRAHDLSLEERSASAPAATGRACSGGSPAPAPRRRRPSPRIPARSSARPWRR